MESKFIDNLALGCRLLYYDKRHSCCTSAIVAASLAGVALPVQLLGLFDFGFLVYTKMAFIQPPTNTNYKAECLPK